MGAPLRQVDIDTGAPQPPRGPFSVASLTLPLQWVVVLLAQTVLAVLWFDHRFAGLEGVPEQIKELRTEIYHQQDAARDLALRDDRIAQLTRRVELLECQSDGRKRCN